MPTLIACLSSGKGTWTEVSRLIRAQQWSQIFLITNNFGKEKFTPNQNTKLIVLDFSQPLPLLISEIKKQLKNIQDFEVALNFISGAGPEHMALLEAVLELGLNFRLVTINNHSKLEVLGINNPTT